MLRFLKIDADRTRERAAGAEEKTGNNDADRSSAHSARLFGFSDGKKWYTRAMRSLPIKKG